MVFVVFGPADKRHDLNLRQLFEYLLRRVVVVQSVRYYFANSSSFFRVMTEPCAQARGRGTVFPSLLDGGVLACDPARPPPGHQDPCAVRVTASRTRG